MIGSNLDQPYKVYSTYKGNGYVSSMRWLAKKLDEDGASVALELHFNAASPRAEGHEWLYWHSSEQGRLFARALRDSFEDSFPQAVSRGIKARKKGSRGAMFLRATSMPACIAEPFFGTNEEEFEFAVTHKQGIAESIAGGLRLYNDISCNW
jgi:N-acetylmuramoyl-L-alanine amidase